MMGKRMSACWAAAGILLGAAARAHAQVPPDPSTPFDLGPAPRLENPADLKIKTGGGFNPSALPPVDTTDRAAVVAYYYNYYVTSFGVAANWTGAIAGCNAGTTSQALKDAEIQAVNYFRGMTGLPSDIVENPSLDPGSQDSALMMIAQPGLSHTPGTTWACYTTAGAAAAGSSNIAIGYYGANAVMGYVSDPGSNNLACGHRRWVLYPRQAEMGMGDTTAFNQFYSGSNDLYVFGTWNATAPPTPEYVPWPPKGYVPYQVIFARWSFSRAGADFSNATVAVTWYGAALPLTVISKTDNGYGDNTIVWEPTGLYMGANWPDHTYTVTISNVIVGGIPKTYTYDVTIIDPAYVNAAEDWARYE